MHQIKEPGERWVKPLSEADGKRYFLCICPAREELFIMGNGQHSDIVRIFLNLPK
jgi:hypothetical protein